MTVVADVHVQQRLGTDDGCDYCRKSPAHLLRFGSQPQPLFPLALEHAASAVTLATRAKDQVDAEISLGRRAAAPFVLGEISAAVADFKRATELAREALYGLRGGIWEAECRFVHGDHAAAFSQTQATARTWP